MLFQIAEFLNVEAKDLLEIKAKIVTADSRKNQ
jgi:hypothetical protein